MRASELHAGDPRLRERFSLRHPAQRLGQRGSHIAFRHPHAYEIVQALIAQGVIGDFRDPDILRFGLTPLTLSHADIWRAGENLRAIVESGAYRQPEFAIRYAVT